MQADRIVIAKTQEQRAGGSPDRDTPPSHDGRRSPGAVNRSTHNGERGLSRRVSDSVERVKPQGSTVRSPEVRSHRRCRPFLHTNHHTCLGVGGCVVARTTRALALSLSRAPRAALRVYLPQQEGPRGYHNRPVHAQPQAQCAAQPGPHAPSLRQSRTPFSTRTEEHKILSKRGALRQGEKTISAQAPRQAR